MHTDTPDYHCELFASFVIHNLPLGVLEQYWDLYTRQELGNYTPITNLPITEEDIEALKVKLDKGGLK